MQRGTVGSATWGCSSAGRAAARRTAIHGLGLIPDIRHVRIRKTHRGSVIGADSERVLGQISGVIHDGGLLPTPDQTVLFGLRDGIVPTRSGAGRAVARGGGAGVELLAVLRAQLPILRSKIERVERRGELMAK